MTLAKPVDGLGLVCASGDAHPRVMCALRRPTEELPEPGRSGTAAGTRQFEGTLLEPPPRGTTAGRGSRQSRHLG